MPAASADRKPGILRRVVANLAQSKSEQHAQALQDEVQAVEGVTPIADCTNGMPVTVSGVLRSVTLRPRERVPAVEAELFDGSGQVLLVWLGRRQIRGIEPGRAMVAWGRITCTDGRPDKLTMFNPRYELRAPGAGIS
ncbi:MAG: OB-fold nucleic acid binding domain-containing protein [Candidatus Nanopelagicales bacterium]